MGFLKSSNDNLDTGLISKIMLIVFFLLLLFVAVVFFYMQQPQFGKAPSGERLEKIKRSPNYKEGRFQNSSNTPALTEGASYLGVMRKFFFGKNKRGTPASALPSVKTNLLELDPAADVLVWFGHSSYFMQVSGKKILVDPVLSGRASPLTFTTRSFNGSDVYTTDDLPAIDYLFLSHDHYDHLDYETIVKLQPKVNKVITGLGVGEHLEYWGYEKSQIIEKDWNEEITIAEGFVVNTAPARHFSGRGFKRNGTLWLSFVVRTPALTLFIGGDSGYDTHFKNIGETFGPFDLVILENGQYNEYWKYIHMMPEEVVQAAEDLKAKVLLPVHWSKFSLALHAWDEPIVRITREAKRKGMSVVHPMIGETLYLKNSTQSALWWQDVT